MRTNVREIVDVVKRLIDGKVKFQNKPVKVHPREIGIGPADLKESY
jgi:hypothetical protein